MAMAPWAPWHLPRAEAPAIHWRSGALGSDQRLTSIFTTLGAPKNRNMWDLCEIYHHQDPGCKRYLIWYMRYSWSLGDVLLYMFDVWPDVNQVFLQENGRWERLLAPRIGDCEALWLTTTIVLLNPRRFKPTFYRGWQASFRHVCRIFGVFCGSMCDKCPSHSSTSCTKIFKLQGKAPLWSRECVCVTSEQM